MQILNLVSNSQTISVFISIILMMLINPVNVLAGGFEKIVVANRDSGSISIIDAGTDQVLTTVNLPDGDGTPEPMYVVNTPANNCVWVGDRSNDRVVDF